MTSPEALASYQDGHARWPEIGLSAEDYGTFLGTRELTPPRGERAADLLLVCACLAGDGAALRRFEREYLAAARGAVARVRPDDDFIDEALQELRTKLLTGSAPRLASYQGQGPLAAWVKVAASRAALDLLRKVKPAHSDAELLSGIADLLIEPETLLSKLAFRADLQAALEAALSGLEARERNVLRMHAVGGLSIDEIAIPYGVHRATVARWIKGIHTHLLCAVQGQMQSAHGLHTGEFASLVHALQSQLKLSIERLLHDEG